MAEKTQKVPLSGLQFYRGLAALGVVCFHGALVARKYCNEPDFGRIFIGGDTGVPFFFVLSGFVIAYAQRGKGYGWLEAKTFLCRRFRRIYYPFWAVCVGVLPAMVWQWRDRPSLPCDLATGVLLIPSDTPPFLGVAWTLVHEVLFYLIFSSLVLSPKWGGAVYLGWQTVIVGTAAIGVSVVGSFGYVLSPLNLLFSLGLIVYRIPQGPAWLGWTVLFIGNLLFAGILTIASPVGEINLGGDLNRLLWAGCCAGMIIYGITQSTVENSLRGALSRLSLLGDASYAIYLVHYPILSIFGKLMQDRLNVTLFYILGVLLSTLVGCCFHLLIEKPLIRK
jgi:exopolysaccharide production protein ExoZ